MSAEQQTKTKTPAQQIATLEAKIARLRQKDRALENGQKIILGGMILSLARSNPKIAKRLLEEIEKTVTREIDKNRLATVIEELSNNVTKLTKLDANS